MSTFIYESFTFIYESFSTINSNVHVIKGCWLVDSNAAQWDRGSKG